MWMKVLAGAALALGVTGAAQAAGRLSVDTPFPTTISPVEVFKADLESIGVGVELAFPTFVNVDPGTTLTFRLLASLDNPASGFHVTSLVVGPTTYDIATQAFTSPGTFLGSQPFSGPFTGAVGFTDSLSDGASPLFWPEGFRVFIRSADEDNLSGIGPFIGDFNTLYFTVADTALFEVTAGDATVPEPATWAAMICGFALVGARLRRSREGRRPPGGGDVGRAPVGLQS